jgi:hypothetical protein
VEYVGGAWWDELAAIGAIFMAAALAHLVAMGVEIAVVAVM